MSLFRKTSESQQEPSLFEQDLMVTDLAYPKKTSKLKRMLLANAPLSLAIMLIIWLWTGVYCFTLYQPKYESSSLVLIKDSALNNRYILDQNSGFQSNTSSSANPVLNTMGLLKGESIKIALWEYFLRNHPEELRKLEIKSLIEWKNFFKDGKAYINARNEPGTDMISIRFTWKKPQIAKEALDTILTAFSNASLELNRAEQKNRSAYLDKQVLIIAKNLDEVRRQKRLYKDKVKTLSIDPQSDQLIKSQIETANSLNSTLARAQGKQAEFHRYQTMLGMSPENALAAGALGLNRTLSTLQDEYYKLSQTYAYTKATLTDKNPKIQQLKMQLTQVESDIKSEIKRTLGNNPKLVLSTSIADETRAKVINDMVTAQAETLQLNAEAEVQRKHLDEINTQISDLPSIEENLSQIEEREKSLSNALYTLRQKEIEAKLKEAETLSNIFIVDEPILPVKPKFPGKNSLLFFGLLLGIVSGIMSIVVRYKFLNLLANLMSTDDPEDNNLSALNHLPEPPVPPSSPPPKDRSEHKDHVFEQEDISSLWTNEPAEPPQQTVAKSTLETHDDTPQQYIALAEPETAMPSMPVNPVLSFEPPIDRALAETQQKVVNAPNTFADDKTHRLKQRLMRAINQDPKIG